jgi:hypothetical protein
MKTIPRTKMLERWDTLPENLREALVSDTTSDFIWKTCQKEFIPDEKIYDVAGIVSFVLFGFIHPEDVAEEIKNTLNIDARISNAVAEAINQRVFEPLRGTLAQFHAPVLETTDKPIAPVRIAIEGMTENPKIISGTTFTATPGSQKNVIIGPKVMQEVKQPGGPSPLTAHPSPLASDIGKPIAHFEPKPNIGGPMANSIAPVKKQESSGEFARLAAQGNSASTPLVKPLTPVAPTTPPSKPVMLQSSSLSKPIQNAPDLNNPQKAVDILAGKKFPVPLPMKPTVIEIGNASNVSHVVNYTDIKAPTSGAPSVNKPVTPAPGRQITEITSSSQFSTPTPIKPMSSTPPTVMPAPTKQAPQPSIMPIQPLPQPTQQQPTTPVRPIGLAPIRIAPTPPTPQINPQAPNEKVIVKDFREGEK